MTETNLDNQLRRIQGLLAKAESTDSPEEATALRAEAERRMMKYRISESQVGDEPGEIRITPTRRDFPICRLDSPFKDTYVNLAFAAVYHVGARGAYGAGVDDDGNLVWRLSAVGYESDLRYAELLYTMARTYFASRMEPNVDPSLSDGENVYRLRRAGIERRRIAVLMGWDVTPDATNGTAHAKVTRLYAEESTRRGEDAVATGRKFSAKTYREAFASNFSDQFSHRLYVARNAAGRDYTGGQLVLANRKETVDEKFYQEFPHLRPVPAVPDEKAKKSRKSGWTKADEARWQRIHGSASGKAGAVSGRAAADEVELNEDKRRLES